ncbi:NRAMP family divalent metal transporter [Paraburkholderia phenoliruptrix]|uniref:Divalent metal cation transporter MntH n=2 Tax=Paraburkholderia phenoliruptrix TaxID=252970 RepID=A0A6J5C2I5_9BURK|nr:divalent metal cation transporter [Paraburkholderia phenoliruptrix]AFT88481.1 natural resistance-associated macrophage protein [Paraburkholderia phenoliruptrix BR3459a]MDR6391480.1 NRAMP (natural resistance-associated macrophage protein)-like metal ion transporter [Paraburkholderia phenoliruptrix]MDR6418745.1 NRAMP (natural resistance-associated macrophage protein)-like metal ion transporter [Paraburkholderia phenoliruptrix]WMY11700.1 divalent metal cation transporter [Paraburkholderia pheno
MDDDKLIEPEAAVRDPVERSWIKRLGPGLITGAADDDPSGIGTYSQAGALFGFNLLWTILLTYPLMTAIQLVSARVGRVTGKGLASNMRAHYPPWLLYGAVFLLLVANVINIAADLSAMGAAVGLLVHGPEHFYVVFLGLFSIALQIFVPYDRYANFLKWTALSLLAYVAVAVIVPIRWPDVARAVVLPHVSLTSDYLTTVVAVLGTTISPYLFFWQASQEVEEMRAAPGQGPLRRVPYQAPAQLRRISFDTWVGMGVSNFVAFFIMLTAAATLHLHHIDVKTSADAARALEPLAGRFAYVLFALGIIGTGLLALPVLAGSAAYAAAGSFRWRSSLALHLTLAREFYAVIALAIVGGVAITFMHFDPIRALYWSAVINGVTAVPIMIVMMLMARSRRVMGQFAVTGPLAWGGWLATLAMAVASIGVFVPS